MKRDLHPGLSFILFNLLFLSNIHAENVNEYYKTIEGKSGDELRTELYNIISSEAVRLSYSGLWEAYEKTDFEYEVWDIYSSCVWDVPADQASGESAGKQCDNYNREHTLPKSWWGGSSSAEMYTDIVHVVPADAYANSKRDNYTYGECSKVNITFNNGGKFGTSSANGYSGTVFEPADQYKGDIARIYFYMMTRYKDRDFTKGDGAVCFSYSDGKADFTDYAKSLFLKWHGSDEVSDKETTRNDGIKSVQNNRNPFVDYPELADHIWGDKKNVPFSFAVDVSVTEVDRDSENIKISVSGADILISAEKDIDIYLYDISGRIVGSGNHISVDNPGIYMIKAGSRSRKVMVEF